MSLPDIFRSMLHPNDSAATLADYAKAADRYRRAQLSGDRDEARKAREALDTALGAVWGVA